ncbi:hypothetical protein N7G274_001378 [Stereocaulon virgatum]|uniref:DUF952 domain-containing protein n=1 Tax=Stereocaulon virgatum TaxID=373712 RepID=A0ABR4ARC6_9LECA
MPAPIPLPEYVYKIVPEASLDPLPSTLPLSALDAKDGFIHLSTADQIPATAGRFFSQYNSLSLLKIPLARIEKKVKWEESSSGCFAHLYGADISRKEVVESKDFKKKDTDEWTKVLEKDAWLY